MRRKRGSMSSSAVATHHYFWSLVRLQGLGDGSESQGDEGLGERHGAVHALSH